MYVHMIYFCFLGAKGARNLQVTVLNNNSVNLTWSEMSSDIPCNGILPLYKLQWRKAYQSSVNVVHVETFSYIVTGNVCYKITNIFFYIFVIFVVYLYIYLCFK